ncbi:MAG: serine--tRNA ligase [Bacteroidales bacterium]|nr:serine--tRNA ligase [Bacteroidales bacterium]
MLTLPYIHSHKAQIIDKLRIKNFDASEIIEKIIETDNSRKNLQASSDQLQSKLNEKSKEVGQLFKSGKQEEANQTKSELGKLKEQIKKLNYDQSEVLETLNDLLIQVPNVPHESVSPGKGEQDNVKVREGGSLPALDEGAVPHWDLIRKYDIIDFDLGIKITGAGFPLYKNKGARLQRALINFFLDQNTEAGYQEYLPPLMVNEDSAFGTGQLPDKEGQMYSVPVDNFYLIPTSEVPVTNIFRDTILDEAQLPVKCTSYTPCFRREAGSWGKDVRGLNRLHQFDKVEIVQIAHPDKSYDTLEEMAAHIESLVVKLGLPYRIMRLCGGDLSFTSALTYDFEVYAAAQQKWLEISSVSNFESYQANRLKLRFKEPGEKKNRLAHTLNGSALALPRVVAALLENNQTPEGIRIPEVLRPYTGFDLIN